MYYYVIINYTVMKGYLTINMFAFDAFELYTSQMPLVCYWGIWQLKGA